MRTIGRSPSIAGLVLVGNMTYLLVKGLSFLGLQFYLFELLLELWTKTVLLGAALRGFACFPAFMASRAADAACRTNWRLTIAAEFAA